MEHKLTTREEDRRGGEAVSDLRDQFDCSPRQYHAGLDILWEAIAGHDLEGETAYHKCASRIASLEAEVERLRLLRREFDQLVRMVATVTAALKEEEE